ncbi:uncharacterized protein LOC133625558 [Colius striatus]|uniref:uncharacterized protein LOC133625558 n=1 Tax=Colius striatus TaxID=57412 RepID=UPI002B1E04F6|nr:uncharacterized protein LOC133625558 [Colius striatus]
MLRNATPGTARVGGGTAHRDGVTLHPVAESDAVPSGGGGSAWCGRRAARGWRGPPRSRPEQPPLLSECPRNLRPVSVWNCGRTVCRSAASVAVPGRWGSHGWCREAGLSPESVSTLASTPCRLNKMMLEGLPPLLLQQSRITPTDFCPQKTYSCMPCCAPELAAHAVSGSLGNASPSANLSEFIIQHVALIPAGARLANDASCEELKNTAVCSCAEKKRDFQTTVFIHLVLGGYQQEKLSHINWKDQLFNPIPQISPLTMWKSMHFLRTWRLQLSLGCS